MCLERKLQPGKDYDHVIKEFEKLKGFQTYRELVLWFEFDLFCQINLIALIWWLNEQDLEDIRISLVCIDRFPGVDNFRGMGQLGHEAFPKLFRKRQQLNESDLKQAATIWLCYCDPDARKISTALTDNTLSAFPFLAQAMQKHFLRFPSTINGLNEQEELLLKTASEGSYSKNQLVGARLQQDRWYGFGDTQYYLYLQRLAPLLSFEELVTMKPIGWAVLANQKNFLEIQPNQVELGGVINTDYWWDHHSHQLVKSP